MLRGNPHLQRDECGGDRPAEAHGAELDVVVTGRRGSAPRVHPGINVGGRTTVPMAETGPRSTTGVSRTSARTSRVALSCSRLAASTKAPTTTRNLRTVAKVLELDGA